MAKIASRRPRRLSALAAAALAAAVLAGCASRPTAPAATPASEPALSSEATGAKAPDAGRERALPTKQKVDYLDEALSDLWIERLANGATVAVKRQAGRKIAAATILLGRGGAELKASEAGFDALALSTAVIGAFRASAFRASAFRDVADGASMEIKIEDYDDVAVEILCPSPGSAALLKLVASALASPAFAQEDFERALREARVAQRKDLGDPLVRAASELRAAGYGDPSSGLPPRGTAESLSKATRESVMRYWSKNLAPERLCVVVVGDFESGPFARELAASFGSIAASSPRASSAPRAQGARAPGLPVKPWFKAIPLAATPGSAVLRGEFGAPDFASADYPAMTVALAMLDDLLIERMRGSGGTKGMAYGAWSRLSTAKAPRASVTVFKTGYPAAAKAAVDAAIAELCSGLCLDLSSPLGKLGPISRSLEAYKSRALTATYAHLSSSAGMAARIARDLASGGDGSSPFRMAARIQGVRSEEVLGVARSRLLEGPSAWVALGDPSLLFGLESASFAVSRK